MAGQRLAGGVAQIGGEGRVALGGGQLEIVVLAEVEFVVAGHEDVEPHLVLHRDDMGALVKARHQRGRVAIAGMAEQHRHALGALGLGDAGRARKAAAALFVAHLVDVVDQQQREGRRRHLGDRGRRGGGERGWGGDDAQGIAAGQLGHEVEPLL